MKIVRKIVPFFLLVMILFAGAVPVSAKSTSGATHTVVNEPVSWTLNPGPGGCMNINAVINGSGQRHEEIVTKATRDGSTRAVYEDLVTGSAVDANGATYTFLYVNHSTWVTPASGTPVAIKMNDLFVLRADNSRVNNLRVAFNWSWTYDPLTSAYWPPVDNFVKTFTVGDPYGCDPI